jgi:hypothetical protein
MVAKRPVPEPQQVVAYLMKHGWVPEDPVPDDGVMLTFREPDDFGEPITVLVPLSTDIHAYPLRVRDVVVTAAGMDDRDEDEVWAEMLATDPAPVAPVAPAPAPHANGSATDAKGVPTP